MPSKPVKIAFDVSDLATNRADGTTRYTHELAKRLPDLGEKYDWLYCAPGNLKQKFSSSNIKFQISPWPKYWTQSRLPFDLIKTKPDVLLMPIQQIPFFQPAGMKTVAVIHDLAVHRYPEQFTYKDWLLLHIFSSYTARHADEIIAVSNATADDIGQYYGRRDNVTVIHHGLDKKQFRLPDNEEINLSRKSLQEKHPDINTPYILYVGQIQPRKNIERLVEAFERIADTDKNLQLVIAGSHGWLKKPIFDRVKKSSFRDRIILPGRIDDRLLPALYWHAEVYVLPSLYEGFGMPILEAMACGCPVVTANVSSMPEVAGKAAVLIDPKNAKSLAEGILKARDNKEGLKKKGLKQAENFSWDKTAEKTLEVILKAIK